MSYRLQTTSAYLVKGENKKRVKLQDLYRATELNGWASPTAQCVVKNTKTGEVKKWFPGEAMKYTTPRKKKKD